MKEIRYDKKVNVELEKIYRDTDYVNVVDKTYTTDELKCWIERNYEWYSGLNKNEDIVDNKKYKLILYSNLTRYEPFRYSSIVFSGCSDSFEDIAIEMIARIRGQQYSAYRVLMYVKLAIKQCHNNCYTTIFEGYVKNILS